MTDPTQWKKFRAKNAVHVLGYFKNIHGERFIIYRMENGDTPYFTGDEVDWKPRERLIFTEFIFSDDERAKVAKIMWPTFADIAEVAKAQESGDSLDVWRPWHDAPEPEIEGS